jgi:hypothetical protein
MLAEMDAARPTETDDFVEPSSMTRRRAVAITNELWSRHDHVNLWHSYALKLRVFVLPAGRQRVIVLDP